MLGLRWRHAESRRAQLDIEYANIMNELRALNDTRLKEAEDLRHKKQETALLHEAVDTLWADRLARYAQTNRELCSYLRALPEALGALKGLTSHYQYMATEMRKFVAFDVACSKVHNLALLLEHGDCVGIHRVAETIRHVFAAEPLVQVVCESVINAKTDVGCPVSINECSTSFVFCMEELDRAIEAAAARYFEFQSEHAEKAPNVLCEGVRRLASEAKVVTLSRGEILAQKERQALWDLLRRDQRQLRTTEDLQCALRYVDDVARQLHRDNAENSELRAIVSSDAAVGAAQQQLFVWRDSAAAFLVRHQAKEALGAYHLLLAETLTKTHLKDKR